MTTALVLGRPIVFQEHEVRAILAGTLTKMRRAITKWVPIEPGLNIEFTGLEAGYYNTISEKSGWVLRSRGAGGRWNDRTKPIHCPFGIAGSHLWVREKWHHEGGQAMVRYKAAGDDLHELKQWKSSSSMPRWACRLVIEILGVHVERLTDISDKDAVAEGFDDCKRLYADEPLSEQLPHLRYIVAFRKMHKLVAITNPWLWVINFKKLS